MDITFRVSFSAFYLNTGYVNSQQSAVKLARPYHVILVDLSKKIVWDLIAPLYLLTAKPRKGKVHGRSRSVFPNSCSVSANNHVPPTALLMWCRSGTIVKRSFLRSATLLLLVPERVKQLRLFAWKQKSSMWRNANIIFLVSTTISRFLDEVRLVCFYFGLKCTHNQVFEMRLRQFENDCAKARFLSTSGRELQSSSGSASISSGLQAQTSAFPKTVLLFVNIINLLTDYLRFDLAQHIVTRTIHHSAFQNASTCRKTVLCAFMWRVQGINWQNRAFCYCSLRFQDNNNSQKST